MSESKLPSLLGPIEFTATSTRLWAANSHYFNPILHVEQPAATESLAAHITAYSALPVIPLPIAIEPSTRFIPKQYEVQIHSQLCTHCQTSAEWSEIFALENTPPRLLAGKSIAHRVSVSRFSYNIPIVRIRTPVRTIPCCAECSTTLSLSHLPTPQQSSDHARILSAHQEAPKGGGTTLTPQPKAKASAAAKSKAKPTIDDLF